MSLGRTILGLRLESKLKVDPKKDALMNYPTAPLCKYGNGGCICQRQFENGPVKCFYKKGPEKCCFEKEQPKDILEKSRT